MTKIQREDIHILSRNSNITAFGVKSALKENINNDKESWQKFLGILFLTLGVGFTVAGIVFFFAYNWTDFDKFTKIGLVEGLIITTTILAVIPKINNNIKNTILSGASVLVGVLFAVFGQIYQTGANAYDFFLAWTLFVTLWVIISNFAPLRLLYLILVNTTFILYAQQVASDWSIVLVFTILFSFNTIILITLQLISTHKKTAVKPIWFMNTLALAAIAFGTIGIIFGIFEKYSFAFPLLILIASIVFTLGIRFGLKTKSGFYLSVIPFSVVLIISSLLIEVLEGQLMFLLVCLFIIASVTFIIKNLINIQKRWTDER